MCNRHDDDMVLVGAMLMILMGIMMVVLGLAKWLM